MWYDLQCALKYDSLHSIPRLEQIRLQVYYAGFQPNRSWCISNHHIPCFLGAKKWTALIGGSENYRPRHSTFPRNTHTHILNTAFSLLLFLLFRHQSRQILKSIVDPVHQHANPSWRDLLKDVPLKLRPLTFDTYTQYIYKNTVYSKQGAGGCCCCGYTQHSLHNFSRKWELIAGKMSKCLHAFWMWISIRLFNRITLIAIAITFVS